MASERMLDARGCRKGMGSEEVRPEVDTFARYHIQCPKSVAIRRAAQTQGCLIVRVRHDCLNVVLW